MRDAHEIRFAAPRLNSGFAPLELGGGGGGDWPLDFQRPLPVIQARPVSQELAKALEAWNQGSGLIDPTRTGTDPGLIDQIKAEYEPGGPWRGDFDWQGYFTGKGLFNEPTPPTNALIGGEGRGPGGSPMMSAQDMTPADDPWSYIKSFDPREGMGLLNWAGLVTGPRQMDTFGHEERMGFGHPEKEFPSVVPGFTVQRAQSGDPTIGMSGWPQTVGRMSARRRNQSMGQRTRDREAFGMPIAGDTTVPVTYNWIKDDTGEVVAKLDVQFDPKGSTYVDIAAVKPEYQRGPIAKQYGTNKFIMDIYKIVAGAGVGVEASLANPKLGEKLGRKGRTDPMFESFVRDWGVDPLERRVTPFGQAEAVSQRREDPYESEHPSPNFYNDPEPLGAHDLPWGSNIPGHFVTSEANRPMAQLATALERRLDADGFGSFVDEIHDANMMSPTDRVLLYLEHMAEHPDYTPRQVSHYRGRMTRAGFERPSQSLSTAQVRLFQRLEDDGWQAETQRIRSETNTGTHPQRQERRIASMLQFMREQGYHPLTISLYERLVPADRLERIRVMGNLGRAVETRTPGEINYQRPVLSNDEVAARQSGMTRGLQGRFDEIMALPEAQRMQAITGEISRVNSLPAPESAARSAARGAHVERLDAEWNRINFRPSDATRAAQVLERRNAARAEVEGTPFRTWDIADMRIAHYLREAGYRDIVQQIRDEIPLRGEWEQQMEDGFQRAHEYLDFMESAQVDPVLTTQLRARLPEPPERFRTPEVEARRHLAEQRSHAAAEARMREIEDEMDSIGHYPAPGSHAYQDYQRLGEEWSNLNDRVDLVRRVEAAPPASGAPEVSMPWRAPGEVSWPNAAFHAYNQLVRDGLGRLANERTRGMQSAAERAREYFIIMREHHYSSAVMQPFLARAPE